MNPLRVERTPARRFFGERATVTVDLDRGATSVEAYGPEPIGHGGSLRPPRVDLPVPVGSVSPEDAVAYAAAIAEAARIAPMLAGPTHGADS